MPESLKFNVHMIPEQQEYDKWKYKMKFLT
jgi:hypothetical protein